jgi:hypothetical protein
MNGRPETDTHPGVPGAAARPAAAPDPVVSTWGDEPPAAAPPTATVRRRHVFFLPGFDRKLPRYYQVLYRNEARKQAAVSPLSFEVDRPAAGDRDSSAWQVRARTADGQMVDTRIEVLRWDDIVARHWPEGAWPVLRDGARTVAWGLADGAVQRMFALYRPPVYAVCFPLVLMLLAALLAVAAGVGTAAGLRTMAAVPTWAAAGLGGALALLLCLGALQAVHRLQMTWLLRLVRFSHRQAEGRVAGLDERLQAFADRIAEVLSSAPAGPGAPPPTGPADAAERPDEVLLVGHSVGATLAVGVAARLLDRVPALAGAAADAPAAVGDASRQSSVPPFAMLSLGHCIPLLSALSPAAALRADLLRVSRSAIPWLDVSAPIDWVAFPAVDPVTGAGLPAAPPGWHPRLVSPRFHQLFGPEAYARLKRNRFRVHLQYLMASQRAGQYDYFALTAGSQRLVERYAEAPGGQAPGAGPE